MTRRAANKQVYRWVFDAQLFEQALSRRGRQITDGNRMLEIGAIRLSGNIPYVRSSKDSETCLLEAKRKTTRAREEVKGRQLSSISLPTCVSRVALLQHLGRNI